MAITKTDDYQYPLTQIKRFLFADLEGETAVAAHVIPPGGIVISGAVVVETASDDTGTAVLDVGDVDDDDRYTSTAVNLKATGRTALTITGHKYVVPTDLLLTATFENDDGGAGEGYIELTIVMEGRENEAVT
jgi:hypothetical protein